MDNAASTDEVDDIVDVPTNAAIINSSGWSPIEPITHANRYQLIQCLIGEEVILKREKNMKAFFHGLDTLKVGELILAHPEKMKSLFVYQEHPLTADSFMGLVASLRPPSTKEAQAFEFFKEYVYYLEGEFILQQGSLLLVMLYQIRVPVFYVLVTLYHNNLQKMVVVNAMVLLYLHSCVLQREHPGFHQWDWHIPSNLTTSLMRRLCFFPRLRLAFQN